MLNDDYNFGRALAELEELVELEEEGKKEKGMYKVVIEWDLTKSCVNVVPLSMKG